MSPLYAYVFGPTSCNPTSELTGTTNYLYIELYTGKLRSNRKRTVLCETNHPFIPHKAVLKGLIVTETDLVPLAGFPALP